MQIDKSLGAVIKIYRHNKGLSQEALGKSIGVTFQQIQKYESGKNSLNAERLVDISAVFGITPGQLLDEAAKTNLPELQKDFLLREDFELLKAYRPLRPSTRKHLRDLVRSMGSERLVT